MSKVKILFNRAFADLCKYLNETPDELQRIIINRMVAEELLETEDTLACGKTLLKQAELYGATEDEFINKVFKTWGDTTTLSFLLSKVYLWGTAEQEGYEACPDCGCAVEGYDWDYNEKGQSEELKRCVNVGGCFYKKSEAHTDDTPSQPITVWQHRGSKLNNY